MSITNAKFKVRHKRMSLFFAELVIENKKFFFTDLRCIQYLSVNKHKIEILEHYHKLSQRQPE